MRENNSISRDIRSILLIQLGDIGDVVLSLPCIRTLRNNFPKSNLIVAVREKAGELIEDCPWASGVISINQDRRPLTQEIAYQKRFFSRVRSFGFDLAIDLRTGTRGATLALLSGARQRIGFYASDGKLWRNRVFTHLAHLAGKPGQHMAEYYLSLLLAYNLKTENDSPEMVIPEQKRRLAVALFKKEKIPSGLPVIAVQPFSLWQYKEWGTDKYVELINRIRLEYKLPVIITGSPDETRRAEEMVKMWGENVFNFAGKTSIGMFAAVLKECSLFIGGDSAGIHVAAALGTPTVSIFGPTSFEVWGPRGKQHCVVQKDIPCVPCSVKGCQGNEVSDCLEELTVDETMPVVKRQIEKILAG